MIERTINLTISPHDGMYIPGQEAHYFECGHSAIQNIKAALDIARLGTPNKILDMACGYGRVLRAIKAVYPSAQITAATLTPGL